MLEFWCDVLSGISRPCLFTGDKTAWQLLMFSVACEVIRVTTCSEFFNKCLGTFCRIEVDSFGHFLTKAKTNVLLAKKEPTWNDVRQLYQMHQMQTIVTDVRSVCLSVCLSVCHECTEWPRLGFTVSGGACSVRRVPCMWGHLVQPSPNAFGFLIINAYWNHPSTSAASSDYWWWSGVKEGTLTQLL